MLKYGEKGWAGNAPASFEEQRKLTERHAQEYIQLGGEVDQAKAAITSEMQVYNKLIENPPAHGRYKNGTPREDFADVCSYHISKLQGLEKAIIEEAQNIPPEKRAEIAMQYQQAEAALKAIDAQNEKDLQRELALLKKEIKPKPKEVDMSPEALRAIIPPPSHIKPAQTPLNGHVPDKSPVNTGINKRMPTL